MRAGGGQQRFGDTERLLQDRVTALGEAAVARNVPMPEGFLNVLEFGTDDADPIERDTRHDGLSLTSAPRYTGMESGMSKAPYVSVVTPVYGCRTCLTQLHSRLPAVL